MLPLKLKDYLKMVEDSMYGSEESIEKLISEIIAIKDCGKNLWVLGNGGSMAIAQHFAQDLLKMCDVKAQAMNCPSMLSAYANDDGFEYSFFNPVRALSNEGDAIMIFSCSGTSRNYIEFVSGFAERRNRILSVVGTDGGFLKKKSDVCVHIDSSDYQVCEAAFTVVADIVVKSLMRES